MLLTFQHRNAGKVYRIVQQAYGSFADALQLRIRLDIRQIDWHQIADVNQTALRGADDPAVLQNVFANMAGADVTVRLGTKVGADNNTVMLVGIVAVQRILCLLYTSTAVKTAKIVIVNF